MAALMLYALVTSLLLGGVALLLDRSLRMARRPTRFVWVGTMTFMSLLPLVGGWRAVRNERVIDLRAPVTTATTSASASASSGGGTASRLLDRGVEQAGETWSNVLDVANLAARADDLLRVLWALLSAFVAGVALHAALEGRRMVHGLPHASVDGTPLRVSEQIGPAAVGGSPSSIVVPRWVLELERPLLELILAHERAHLEARNPALLTFALMLVVVQPWNPLLWWGWGRLRAAIEMDCDARVLSTNSDVRRYGQLLLLMSQRTATPSLAMRPVLTVAAPLHSTASQLQRRIVEMTRRTPKHLAARVALLGSSAAAVAVLTAALPGPANRTTMLIPTPPGVREAVVSITSAGTTNVEFDEKGQLRGEVLIYGRGPVSIGLGSSVRRPLTDTLRLKMLPAFTADVTEGELHVKLVGAGRGTISLAATVTGGLAGRLSASADHIVFHRGGTGVRGGRPGE